MLVCGRGWGHLQLKFVWLRRRKTWAGLIPDIVTIAKAAVYVAYGYGQLERCSETEVGFPTYWIVDRGARGGLAGQTPEPLGDSAGPTQSRLCVRIPSHSRFWRGEGEGVESRRPRSAKFLYWKTVASHAQASQKNTNDPRFLRGREGWLSLGVATRNLYRFAKAILTRTSRTYKAVGVIPDPMAQYSGIIRSGERCR